MTNTIILPKWLITSPNEPPKENWGVRVIADTINDIAPNAVLREKYPEDLFWEAESEVLTPGFVNSHIHLYGVLAHGIPLTKAPSGFWQFLNDFWWHLVEDRLDKDMICCATDLRCAQLLKSGVTSLYDCTEAPYALPGCLFAQSEVVKRRGIRAVLSFEATERVSQENGMLGLNENAAFIDHCKKEGGFVHGQMCHHTTFTCSDKFIRKALQMAQERSVLLHAHVSEGTYEPEYTMKNFGVRTIHYYDQLGIAGQDFMASQCVHIDESEIALMAKRGVRVTHMPLSNCEVGGGIAPIPQLINAGVNVGLGSDGYIDDFFEVMRGAFLIHKAKHQDAGVMPAPLVWYLATEGGARAMKLEKVGRIEKGWQADIQLIDGNLPTPLEDHNIYDQLLLYRSACDVRAVMVAGRVLVKDGEVIGVDWEELYAHTRESAQKLWLKTR